ncbi:zinc finger, C3HC4 type (RING finger) domain-containing protein [Toxoplasma gondii VAND]|uniref:Zinc finger, C3HC4 type (RING finger) domain-containing protein n=1 Tax=Toxoplasma gondii VAND TaxID=933077 RepID=A0A086QKG4_TOXGO|nr:zinc finger, C3HC4 type (RING finger) domain-containing protein [Toxoplasma gondii VAND]
MSAERSEGGPSAHGKPLESQGTTGQLATNYKQSIHTEKLCTEGLPKLHPPSFSFPFLASASPAARPQSLQTSGLSGTGASLAPVGAQVATADRGVPGARPGDSTRPSRPDGLGVLLSMRMPGGGVSPRFAAPRLVVPNPIQVRPPVGRLSDLSTGQPGVLHHVVSPQGRASEGVVPGTAPVGFDASVLPSFTPATAELLSNSHGRLLASALLNQSRQDASLIPQARTPHPRGTDVSASGLPTGTGLAAPFLPQTLLGARAPGLSVASKPTELPSANDRPDRASAPRQSEHLRMDTGVVAGTFIGVRGPAQTLPGANRPLQSLPSPVDQGKPGDAQPRGVQCGRGQPFVNPSPAKETQKETAGGLTPAGRGTSGAPQATTGITSFSSQPSPVGVRHPIPSLDCYGASSVPLASSSGLITAPAPSVSVYSSASSASPSGDRPGPSGLCRSSSVPSSARPPSSSAGGAAGIVGTGPSQAPSVPPQPLSSAAGVRERLPVSKDSSSVSTASPSSSSSSASCLLSSLAASASKGAVSVPQLVSPPSAPFSAAAAPGSRALAEPSPSLPRSGESARPSVSPVSPVSPMSARSRAWLAHDRANGTLWGRTREEYEAIARALRPGVSVYEATAEPRRIDESLLSKQTTLGESELRCDLSCPICMGIFQNVVVVKDCLHRFCADCIEKCVRTGLRECPQCRIHVASRRALRPDPIFERILNKLFPDVSAFEAKNAELITLSNLRMRTPAARFLPAASPAEGDAEARLEGEEDEGRGAGRGRDEVEDEEEDETDDRDRCEASRENSDESDTIFTSSRSRKRHRLNQDRQRSSRRPRPASSKTPLRSSLYSLLSSNALPTAKRTSGAGLSTLLRQPLPPFVGSDGCLLTAHGQRLPSRASSLASLSSLCGELLAASWRGWGDEAGLASTSRSDIGGANLRALMRLQRQTLRRKRQELDAHLARIKTDGCLHFELLPDPSLPRLPFLPRRRLSTKKAGDITVLQLSRYVTTQLARSTLMTLPASSSPSSCRADVEKNSLASSFPSPISASDTHRFPANAGRSGGSLSSRTLGPSRESAASLAGLGRDRDQDFVGREERDEGQGANLGDALAGFVGSGEGPQIRFYSKEHRKPFGPNLTLAAVHQWSRALSMQVLVLYYTTRPYGDAGGGVLSGTRGFVVDLWGTAGKKETPVSNGAGEAGAGRESDGAHGKRPRASSGLGQGRGEDRDGEERRKGRPCGGRRESQEGKEGEKHNGRSLEESRMRRASALDLVEAGGGGGDRRETEAAKVVGSDLNEAPLGLRETEKIANERMLSEKAGDSIPPWNLEGMGNPHTAEPPVATYSETLRSAAPAVPKESPAFPASFSTSPASPSAPSTLPASPRPVSGGETAAVSCPQDGLSSAVPGVPSQAHALAHRGPPAAEDISGAHHTQGIGVAAANTRAAMEASVNVPSR